MKADDVKRLKELERENSQLKRLGAHKELENLALKEAGVPDRRSSIARPSAVSLSPQRTTRRCGRVFAGFRASGRVGATAALTRSCSARGGRSTASGCSASGARRAYGSLSAAESASGSGTPRSPRPGCALSAPIMCGRLTSSSTRRRRAHILKLLHVVDEFTREAFGDHVRAEHRRGRDRRRP